MRLYKVPKAAGYFQYLQLDAVEIAYWQGVGAQLLGLQGEVKETDFLPVRDGLDPSSKERLRLRAGEKSIALYDAVTQAPKSVSVMGMHDQRLIAAHKEAVAYARQSMERLAMVRVKVNRLDTMSHATQNVVQAVWHHQTSRAGDPHLHTHCATINMSYDPADGRWRALNVYGMMKEQHAISDIYRYVLARRVEEFGYRTVPTENKIGFQIEGVPETTIQKYSQRRAEYAEALEGFRLHHDREPTPGERDTLIHKHRPEKLMATVPWDIRERQLERLTPDENRALIRVHEQALERRMVYEINMPRESYRWQDQIGELKQISAAKMNADFSRDKIDPELLEKAQRFAMSDRIDHEPELRHHPWTYAEESLRKGYRYRVA